MDYVYWFFMLVGAFFVFKASSWVVMSAIRLAFTIGFVVLGVLAMSSTVGLL